MKGFASSENVNGVNSLFIGTIAYGVIAPIIPGLIKK